MKNQDQYDVIIVGGSYAGMAAAMALGRALRKVLIIDSGSPCNQTTPYSHNFLTNDGKTPLEISGIARKELQNYDSVELITATAVSGRKTELGFQIKTHSGATFSGSKLIMATGIKDQMPEISGFAECWGISVLHCPYCHGYEVRHQKTGILANGDTAYELSSLIANWTNDLTLYTDGKHTLTEQQLAKLEQHQINILETQIQRIEHKNGKMQHIVFNSGEKSQVAALYARLPFLQHADIPESLGCEFSPEGYLKIDAGHQTNIPGVFACGDNVSRMRTVANAVAMGTTTGLMVNKALIEERF